VKTIKEPEVSGQPPRSSFWKLQGILFEPKTTFEEVDRRPNWLVPLLAMIVISIAASAYVISTIGMENLVRTQIEANRQIRDLPPEQRERIVQNAVESPQAKIGMYVGPVLGPVLIVLIVAGLLMLVAMLTGGHGTFKKVFSVSCHAFFFSYFVASALMVVVVLLTPDPSDIDVQNPVATNLGFLISRTESPALYSVLSSIDLISFYTIYLLGLGLSVVNRKPLRSGIIPVVILWAIYVLLKTAWAAWMG
jgi:hypothetical protein